MRSILYSLIYLTTVVQLSAQPINDDCINAITIPVSASEELIILTDGDTRDATQSTTPQSVCAQTWHDDDVWFSFTKPFTTIPAALTVKAYFDYYVDTTDVAGIGMALYKSCDALNAPLRCFDSNDPKENNITIDEPCVESGHTYYIRIWSTGNTSATEGTFRIGVFVNESQPKPLWKETFGYGIENNGWTTGGTCEEPDSNHNAGFTYHADGIFDDGLWINAGFAINSPSLCDGAVGVDSDYNNTGGIESDPPLGPYSRPSMHYLISPVIYSRNWTAPGITLSWHQALRNFESDHFVAFRWRDEFSEWSDWEEIQVNVEYPGFGQLVTDDIQRHFLPQAAHHDSLQIRFRYVDYFYFWIIDDVELVETEANNIELDKEFFAIPPFAQIPANQVDEYFALTDINNIGVNDQHDVQLHHSVRKESSNEIVDAQTLTIGDLPALLIDTTKWFFSDPVNIPAEPENFIGIYKVTQFEADFDTTDNAVEYHFTLGGSTFAHEDGPTGILNLQEESVFIKTDAWGYGNVFYPVRDVAVSGITFGVVLPKSLPGDSINLNLIEWHDQNEDQYAQFDERRLVGRGSYLFGEAKDWIISTVPLTNVSNPGAQVIMEGGKIYFAMMEYAPHEISWEGKVRMLVSEERNFIPTVAAYDSAYAQGLTDRRRYMSVLQFSPDGVISNVDFFVRQFPNGWAGLHPGDSKVPMIRVETEFINAIEDVHSSGMISAFPNPARDFIQVEIATDRIDVDFDLTMVDVMGRIVHHIPNVQVNDGKYQFDIREYASGVYTIVVRVGDRVFNKSVIVL